MTILDAATLSEELANCYGTDNYYKHLIGGFSYTDGVKVLVGGAECHWLIDAIASYQPNLSKMNRETGLDIAFQVWTLTRREKGATLKCDCPAITQHINFTDFPFAEFTLFLYNGVLLLPSEN